MYSRSVKDQVMNGLTLSAKGLVGFATIGMFWAAITVIISPERVRSDSFLLVRFGIGTHSFVAGWICLAASTAIRILTMERWVRVLPGFFAYSTVAPLIMLSGQYSGVPVPRSAALFLTLFTISTAAVSLTFKERKLHFIDRVALMAFLFCLGIGMTPKQPTMFTALSIGFAFLLLAWGANRVKSRSADKSSGGRLHGPAAGGTGPLTKG
jgi:hypothetical protein